jgi:hypothetical protein
VAGSLAADLAGHIKAIESTERGGEAGGDDLCVLAVLEASHVEVVVGNPALIEPGNFIREL